MAICWGLVGRTRLVDGHDRNVRQLGRHDEARLQKNTLGKEIKTLQPAQSTEGIVVVEY